MSIVDRISKSLDSQNLQEFTELVNIASININDVFANGLLHHMISKYPELPLEFYRVVIENPNTNINYSSPDILPPIIRVTRKDIIDLLISKPALNVNVELTGNRNLAIYAIEQKNLTLLEMFIKTGRLDITQNSIVNYAMSKNMDAFRMLIGLLEPYMCNNLKAVDHSIRTNNPEALDLLLGVGCGLDTAYVTELVDTSNPDMIQVLIKYLQKIADKRSIMALAVNNNNIELFRAVSKFIQEIQYIDIYNNLDKPEIIAEIIKLANTREGQRVAPVLFTAIVKSRQPKHYLFLGKFEMNVSVLAQMLNILLETEQIDELDEILKSTDIFKGVIKGEMADKILSNLIESEKIDTIKMLLSTYDLRLGETMLYLDGLVEGKHYDILLEILDKYKINISVRNYPMIDDFIEDEQYDLVRLLIEKYKILPFERDVNEKLFSRPDIIRAIIKSNAKMVVENMSAEDFVKVMVIIDDDTELLKNVLDRLTVPIIRSWFILKKYKNLMSDPEHLLKVLEDPRFTPLVLSPILDKMSLKEPYHYFDTNVKFVIFELLLVMNDEQKEALLNAMTSDDLVYNLVDEFIFFTPLDRILIMDESSLFGYILEHFKYNIEKIDNPNLGNYVRLNPIITLEHIDEILDISNISVKSSVQHLMNIFDNPKFNELFRSSNIIDKVLDHRNMELNSLIYDETDEDPDENEIPNKISILDSVLGVENIEDTSVKNWKNMEQLRILKKLLSVADLDVNIRNTLGLTAAESLIEYIPNFVDVDYESEEHFSYYQAALRLILAHPNFNINSNRGLFPIIFNSRNDELNYLLTVLISRPECDVNYCRLLHGACNSKKPELLQLVLSIPNVDVNLVAVDDVEGTDVTPMHVAIERQFVDGIKLLLEDPRLDVSVLDGKGRNYSRLAAKTGLREIVALFATRGVVDDKQVRIEREIAEYEARMAAQGRVKQTRIRETLNSFDLILKERENTTQSKFGGNITTYSRSLCPFCLTYLEKENAYECVYLGGHTCPEELENEPLKRLYFGDEWNTKVFEICCTCGRPCEHHGHFTSVEVGGPTELAVNDSEANHWNCNEHNGGGGKLEMVTRLIGMLSELKRRVDADERLVYGPELIRELATIANSSLFNGAIRDRAVSVLERKKWNVNSKIPKYTKFNAPTPIMNNNSGASAAVENTREPIVHYENPDEELQCMICFDEAQDLFRPHENDEGYICDSCIRRQVCESAYASVTCELGCRPKKQIYRDDVNALLDGNFC